MFRLCTKFNLIKCNTNLLKLNSLLPKSIYKNIIKHVSQNPQSKVNRENRELDKIEKFWEDVDQGIAEKAKIEKEVENRYKLDSFHIGKHIVPNTPVDPSMEVVDVYYVPLTKEDGSLLSNFSKSTSDSIIKGGRIVLLNEINNYNRSQPIEKHLKMTPEFEPLTNDEVKEIQYLYYELFQNEKVFNFILQNGKPMLNELRKIREHKIKLCEDYRKSLNYVDHYGEVINTYPFNTKIAHEFQKYDDPHYIKLFLKEKKVDEVKLTETLKNIYFDFYKGVSDTINKTDNTTKGLNRDSIEPCLFDRTNAFIDYLKLNNLKFEVNKGDLPLDQEKYFIFEKLFFKGVTCNRYQNDEPNDYILVDSHEDMGIRYYLHKYLTGESSKYHSHKNPITPLYEFNTDDYHNSLEFYVKERNRKIVMRVYMFLKHPFKVSVKNNSNTDLIEYKEDYTYNHLAVFENELESPNHTFLINNNFESWMNKHKFGEWKLVDVDNFMKGNPFFLRKSSFLDSFEKIINDDKHSLKALEAKFPDVKNPEVYNAPKESKGTKEPKDDKKGKKDKKGKDGKEEKTTTATTTVTVNKTEIVEDPSMINSLQFDYKVTMIPRPVDETPEDIKKMYAEATKEYNKLLDAEYRKKADVLENQNKRQAEMKRALEVVYIFNC